MVDSRAGEVRPDGRVASPPGAAIVAVTVRVRVTLGVGVEATGCGVWLGVADGVVCVRVVV
jgi:hypothetical protein